MREREDLLVTFVFWRDCTGPSISLHGFAQSAVVCQAIAAGRQKRRQFL